VTATAPQPKPPPPPPAALDRRTFKNLHRVSIVIVVIAVLATFWRSCGHEFVAGWDDQQLIYANPLVNPPTPEALVKLWREPHARMYIPAVYTTWWWLAKVAQVPNEPPGTAASLNPWVFHTANLLVHLAAALTVLEILRRLIKHESAALVGALVFALHPLQVEPVAWATGMKDVLCGLFALRAILHYVAFVTDDGGGKKTRRRRSINYATALGMLVIALFAKPAAIVVPLIVIVIDGLEIGRSWKRVALSALPLIVVAVPCVVWTTRAQPTPELVAPAMTQRLIGAADALGFYLFKLIWPARLGIDYGLKPDVLVKTTWGIAFAAAVALVAISRERRIIAGLLIFILGVAPVLGLTPFVFQGYSTVADRYVYLSMLGVALAVATLVAHYPRPQLGIVCGIVIIALAVRSFLQVEVWANDETLMRHALTVNPNSPAANNNLGILYFTRGDYPAAQKYYATAVAAQPGNLPARDNLAATLIRLDRVDEAIAMMKETLAIRRKLPPPLKQPIDGDLSRLADLLMSRGRYEEAGAFLEELSRLYPYDSSVRMRLEATIRAISTRPSTPR
jgi:hypothetical protein